MVDLEKLNACPECGSNNVLYKKVEDEIICKDCGAIFSELTKEDEEDFEDASDVI